MPGSWGWSRALVPFLAGHSLFLVPEWCDSEKGTTQTESARAHTWWLFPPRGTETCFNTSKAPLLQVPRTHQGVLGRGEQMQEVLCLCKKCQVTGGLGIQGGVQQGGNTTFPSPGPPASRSSTPFPCGGKKGDHSQVMRSQHSCGCEHHELNSLTRSSSILLAMGIVASLCSRSRKELNTIT